MKRILLIVGALLAIVIVVIGVRRPIAEDPNALVAPSGATTGATTVDLGDGWFADVRPDGDQTCVVLRNDVAQSICVPASTVEGGSQIRTTDGRGLRLTVAFVGNAQPLTAQWSSRDLSGGPCCLTARPMVEIEPDVWMSYFATPDDDEHWGVQFRNLDGGLFRDHSLLPPG